MSVLQNLVWKSNLCHVLWSCMAKLCFNPSSFNLMYYTVFIIYTHGTGSILNVLNNSLQFVFLVTLQINLTTFFCNLNTFVLCESPPQKRIPYLRCEWKFAKYMLLKVFILVTSLSVLHSSFCSKYYSHVLCAHPILHLQKDIIIKILFHFYI